MRLLLDLQAIQGAARNRGLGRYSLEFGAAIALKPDVSEVVVLLNGGLSARSLLESRDLVRSRIPSASIEVFDAPWPWLSDGLSPAAHSEAELVRDQFIHELQPDAVVVCSLFSSPYESVTSVPESGRPPTAVITYDLLQLTDRDSRLADAPPPWFQHRLESLARADLLLCISDHTAGAVRQVLGPACPPTATIWGASFSLPEVPRGTRRGVLVAGGDGRRKNEASTVRAFARLPEAIRRQHPLTVVGRQSHKDLDPASVARECDLAPDEYEVVGTEISDEELARRYAAASVVVMPSRGEGLGMPVLEAWRFGTPAIASNVTSLPELIGDQRWTFDPEDVTEQANLLESVLGDEAVWARAARYAEERARTFSWDRTAQLALSAIEGVTVDDPPSFQPMGRPTLAFVTPWPPQSTGIARHAQVMARFMHEHYEVNIVSGDASAAAQARTDGYTVLDPGEFEERGSEFDRILIQLGNNPYFHHDELALLKRWPCVVVAHDLDLVHLVGLSDGSFPGGLPVLRYSEAGLAGPLDEERPVGIDIFRGTLGVIVHSEAASKYLTEQAHSRLPISLVHAAPLALISETSITREEARSRLGVADSEVLIATFGRVEPEKGVHTIAEAFTRLFDDGLPVKFVAVGPAKNIAYRDLLEGIISDYPAQLTDEVTDEVYGEWLAAADIAIQLRPGHRGETSAALLEALAAGCATIVEAVGSMGELAELGAVGLPSPVGVDALTEALRTLVRNADLREELQIRVASVTRAAHSPEVAAQRYHEAIEAAYATWGVPRDRSPRTVAQARSLAANRPDRVGPTMYVDVTSLVETTRRTGIERVMASLCRALAEVFPGRVFPVWETGDGLRHAGEVISELLSGDTGAWGGTLSLPTDAIRFRAGDVLFCPENKEDPLKWLDQVTQAKALGATYVQMAYDLLPLSHPDFFPPFVGEWFGRWLRFVSEESDLVACISEATEAAFREYSAVAAPGISGSAVTWIRLAADLGNSQLVRPELRVRARGSRRVLVVGTIEPRKGIEVVLDAAENLWRRGEDVEFAIVGRPGWASQSIISRLQSLADSAHSLSWMNDASDLDLQWEYLNADLLVMASRGEGFGLPIMEAVAHGVPVVARDLPVFRELLGPEGDYFTLDGDLPDAIMRRIKSSAPVTYVPDRLVNWRETAQDLLSAIERHLAGRV